MQSLGNTEWLLNRAASRPAVAQSVGIYRNPTLVVRDLVIPAIDTARSVPAWVIMTSVLLAASAICGAAILRTRAELSASAAQQIRVQSEIHTLREANQSVEREIQRLMKDPGAIELAARERLGMVKASDIVVTTDSIQHSSNASTVSFIR